MRRYLLLLAIILAPAAWAATITVTSTADSGAGSLRAALTNAASGDSIVFNVGSHQTITLGSTLTVGVNVAIDGAGSPGLVISGNHAVQVFQVASGVTASLAHLTVANGNAGTGNGGGIESWGNLTITACTLTSNNAFIGGAIYANGGQLSVVNSTFAGNTANDGAGIGAFNSSGSGVGVLTVRNSTFVGNNASDLWGGGIASGSATASIVNSLFLENTAPHGIGGSIFGGQTTIVADHNLYWNNADALGVPSNDNCDGCRSNTNAVTADPLLGSLASNGGPTQTFLPGAGSAAIDAGLDSACPATDQRGLSSPQYAHCNIGSVETGWLIVTSTSDDVNDTGSLRHALTNEVYGEGISFNLGANQIITLASPLTIANSMVIDGSGSAGLVISGNHAVQVFQVNSGVTASLAHLTVANGNASNGGGISNLGNLTVKACTLTGNNASNGGGISNSGNLTIDACTLTGNNAYASGAIDNFGQLSVLNSTISNNTARFEGGGGIGNSGTALTVNNSTFVGNSASGSNGSGGAIENRYTAGAVSIVNSLFQGNTALNGLGGSVEDFQHSVAADHNLYWDNADLAGAQGDNCDDCLSNTNDVNADPLLGYLANNGGPTLTYLPGAGSAAIDAGSDPACPATDQRGGPRPLGAHCDIGSVEINWLVVTSTSDDVNDTGSLRYVLAHAADGDEVAFNVGANQTITLGSTLTIANSIAIDGAGSPGLVISGNHSVGVFSVNSGVTSSLAHLTVANGNATEGGGIYNAGNLTVDACTLTGNAATTDGGGISNKSGQVSVVNSTFSGNTSLIGGGILNSGGLTVNNSSFVGNSVNGRNNYSNGAGIANYANSTLAVANSLFEGNTAPVGSGGSIWNYGASVATADHNLYWNNADTSGAQGTNCANCSSNTNAVTDDPLLGSLKNNGGPTQTYAPYKGTGKGIDAGLDSTCAATDQRGVARPLGAHCDIGSVESDVIFSNGFE